MSVRARTSPNRKGGRKVYVADYRDQNGKRHIKTFPTKKAAKEHADRVALEVRNRTHIAPSTATTIRVAALCWIDRCKDKVERATLRQYESHVFYHIAPYFEGTKIIAVDTEAVLEFQRWMHKTGRSAAMVQKVSTSLYGIFTEAKGRKMIVTHPMHGMERSRRTGKARKRRIEVGTHIPSVEEIRRLTAVLPEMPFWQPVILTLILTGIRASEARGLRWSDVDFRNSEINVRQRIDSDNEVGPPKSDAGTRTIPIRDNLMNVLREWRLACPNGGLAFPDKHGNPMRYEKLTRQGLHPAMIRAGLVTPDGKSPKYTGAHHLRHFFASYCLNRRADHGLELSPQIVQKLLGHAGFQMTVDLYGHLFRTNDDDGRLAAGESYLMGR